MFLTSSLSILLYLSAPFIVLANFLILCVWFRFKRLRTPSNALLMSLAAADFGFGLFLPIAVTIDLTVPTDQDNVPCNYSVYCVGPLAILLTFSAASLLSTAAVALDRLTSVAQPLRYNHFVTMSHVHRFIVVYWLYAVLLGILLTVVVSDTRAQVVIAWLSVFLYGPCLLSAIMSYTYIYFIARNHARAIYSVEVHLANGNTCQVLDTSSMHHHRYGLTLAMILGSVIVCWVPIQVCALIDVFGESSILQDHDWRMIAALPVVLNSLINPWLYAYRSSEVRLAILRLIESVLTKISGRPQTINILYYQQQKGEMTSCASNVRLINGSPSQTTVQCCHSSNGVANNEARKVSNSHVHLMVCDQVSVL
ncbi:unnamed protein product [Orchesella dallaii]|uniref:G-protein coupled receptors family 1 profile domain-containing protein n=1 Tax=Orchesella dallaii TaxID=48710 RepID=A0ABP1QWZ9_9HEXA